MNFILNKNYFLVTFLVFTVFMVYGCSSSQYYKSSKTQKNSSFYKEHKKGFNKSKKPLYHQVKKGESLYSIAWEYGMDFKRLAWINRIKSPYIIKRGEKIRLKSKKETQKKTYKKKVSAKKKKTTGKKNSKKTKYKYKSKKRKSTKTKKVAAKKKITKTTKKSKKHKYKTKLSWAWPLRGKIIQYFSPSKGKKGIDIAVRNRAPVKSAESGKVVYSGYGLTGYGHLVIIKHNNKYLSAYAHNSKLLVEEGDIVKRKQLIAYSGKTSSDRVKLHFEIRKNGKPVNPINYLPK